MKYIYKESYNPKQRDIQARINHACTDLSEKIQGLNLAKQQISEYNQRYLGGQIGNITPALQTYAYLIELGISGQIKPIEQMCFVDYGAGSGLMSLLLKELGIGTVIYNDIYDVSCEDARKLSNALNLPLDHFVLGGIDELSAFLDSEKVEMDCIISFDVIEHIYDIETYLRLLPTLSEKPFAIVFGSGANDANPILRRRYAKAQLKCENEARRASWGHKERDSLKAYIEIRKEIVNQEAPSLDDQAVNYLALNTRGLIVSDIKACVSIYLDTGELSHTPDHPTNTCDPYTGNWAEHLMSTEWLTSVLENIGFAATTKKGYWGEPGGALKSFIARCLNITIDVLGAGGMTLSPYYVIHANNFDSRFAEE